MFKWTQSLIIFWCILYDKIIFQEKIAQNQCYVKISISLFISLSDCFKIKNCYSLVKKQVAEVSFKLHLTDKIALFSTNYKQ